MKKWICLLQSMILLLTLCSCKSSGSEINQTSASTPTDDISIPTETTAPTMPAEPVEEIRTDGFIYEPCTWASPMSHQRGISLRFELDEASYPGMTITVDLSAPYGSFCTYKDIFGENTTLSYPFYNLFWTDYIDVTESPSGAHHVFIEGIIRADGHIVGYGIYEIGTNNSISYASVRSETVSFPMINGQLQDISEEYVAERLEEMKQIITPFDYDEIALEQIVYFYNIPADRAREDGLIYQPLLWCSTTNDIRGVPIKFDMADDAYPGTTITVELTANNGGFWSWQSGFTELVVDLENHSEVYWLSDSDSIQEVFERDGAVFVEAIIRADGNIVGYGIYEIGTEDFIWYTVSRCETVCFPKIKGELQKVTEEDVAQRLSEKKQIVTPFVLDEKRAEEQAYLEALYAEQFPEG